MLGLSANLVEGMGFDIDRDSREEWNLTPVRAWVAGENQASLKYHPNPPAVSLTEIKK